MVDARDAAFMARALLVAERGRGHTSPNPIVGAVVVDRDGIVVGHGAHRAAGGPHAEVFALEMAGSRARGGTLYSTLEPCCHTGRTGPCVERIVSDGVARVVFALGDPNPLVAGGGARFLRARGVTVDEGVRADEARRQNAAFLVWMEHRRPFVIAKCAASADGFIGRPGERVPLTGPETDRFFHRQRAEIDALAVGSGTILTDDPWLTARGAFRSRPLVRVVFDWSLRVQPSARLFSTLSEGPVIMVVSARAAETHAMTIIALERRGIGIERRVDRSLAPVLRWLGAREITTLLVEGGPTLHQSFCEAGLVDRFQVVITPHVIGRGTPLPSGIVQDGRWRLRPPTREWGADRLVEWDVHRTH
jgi:diaminohydroxyphosphoribosylaminopyrimidine deaminase/5-amino-6-(5-phosphoribosylamino)uracil reductase